MNSMRKTISLTLAATLVASIVAAPAMASPLQFNDDQGSITVAQNMQGEWRGYHGQRGPRQGYRQGPDGWWYPLAAFAAGAILGGAAAGGGNPPPPPGRDMPPPPPGRDMPPPPPGAGPRHHLPPEHYAWCAKRYKSYRTADNTYVVRAGVRAECMSPFVR